MSTKHVISKIVSVILAIILFVSFSAGLAMGTVKNSAESPSALAMKITDPEYYAKAYGVLMSAIDARTKLVVVETEDLTDILTQEMIEAEASKALISTINAAYGDTSKKYSFECPALLERIDTILTKYAEDNGIEYAEGSADKVYTMICDTVTAELSLLPASIVSKAAPATAALKRALSYAPLFLIVSALCAGGMLLLGRRRLRAAAYNVSTTFFLSSFTVFALSNVLFTKNYLSNITIGNEALKYAIKQLQNVFLGEVRSVSLILAVIFALISIVTCVVLAIHRSQKRPSRHRHKQ